MNNNIFDQENQYLSFNLDDEIYAINIFQVKSILDFYKYTKVPKTPDFMRGVINLRGAVVPIADLKSKFELSLTEKNEDTCIIITEIQLEDEVTTIGLLVDSVQAVIDLEADQIEQPPKIGTLIRTDFITGMGKANDKFIMILDLPKIFTTEELEALTQSHSKMEMKVPELQPA